MKIAVFVDEEGVALPLNEKGTVALYTNENESKWECSKKIPFDISYNMSMVEMRKTIQALVAQIDDCKTIVAENVKGMHFAIFEGVGVNIWKYKGNPESLLDYIKEQEDKIMEEKLRPKPAPRAVGDIRDGFYEINMIKAMEQDKTLTTKQILIPFLQNTNFQKLKLVCSHIPKWCCRDAVML